MLGSTLPDPSEVEFHFESKHPIYEVELLSILIALEMWGKMLDKCQLVCYLDNDAARAGLIRGSHDTC